MRDTTRTRARKYGKDADCHLVARTCGNEVGVAISIRDPYTSPFTSWCKFARCLLLVRCLCSETVAIGFLISVEPNFVERNGTRIPETTPELLEVTKRHHNFGTKRFKEKSLFIISCPYRAEVADTAVCMPDCARCQNKENTHTHRQTHRISTVTLAHARRGLIIIIIIIIINNTSNCQCTECSERHKMWL